jgi:hypothetical protein
MEILLSFEWELKKKTAYTRVTPGRFGHIQTHLLYIENHSEQTVVPESARARVYERTDDGETRVHERRKFTTMVWIRTQA